MPSQAFTNALCRHDAVKRENDVKDKREWQCKRKSANSNVKIEKAETFIVKVSAFCALYSAEQSATISLRGNASDCVS